MIDEPLVVPISPGAAIVRLSQVSGAIEQHEFVRHTLPQSTLAELQAARAKLLQALEQNERAPLETAFRAAQDQLRTLYETMCQPGLWENIDIPAEAHNAYSLLGFPEPLNQDVQPVDAGTVLATFSKPQRQVLTSLTFQDAANATAYWLIELRTLRGEILEDHLYESSTPFFTRVRLPIGPHTFKIQSRDPSYYAVSEPFTIEVPNL